MTPPPSTTQIPRRVTAAALALGLALLVTIVAGDARERAALPDAVHALRSARSASAALVSCFEGVQDDLYGGVLPDDTIMPFHADAAAARLRTCDPDELGARLAAVSLPAPAPVTNPGHLELRRALTDAVAALERTTLEARTTQRAFEDFLAGDPDAASDAVIAFRAVKASYEASSGLIFDAEQALARLHPADVGRRVTSAGQG